MEELISIILVIVAISKLLGKAGAAASQVEQLDKRKSNWGAGTYQAPRQAMRQESPRVQVQQQTQQEIQEKIARTKQRLKNEFFQQADEHRQQENRQAMQQVHASRVEARNTTIVDRAKGNVDVNNADVTLETMEAEHHHSERVSAAVHHHPEDVIPESMLGNVEDLMITGYDGKLCFERDFLGEAMDMISRFTVPSEVPDFTKDDVA